jgi:hypothetical protein
MFWETLIYMLEDVISFSVFTEITHLPGGALREVGCIPCSTHFINN